jgi:salicylate biosynthesis isochorismate synthase
MLSVIGPEDFSPKLALAEALATPRRDAPLFLYSWPAPATEAWRLLAALPEEEGHYLATSEGESAGVGVVRRWVASGPGRGERLADEAGRWLREALVSSLPGSSPPRPRLYGSLGFEADAADSADFVLPRWRYERTARGARLSVAVRGGEGDRLQAELERIWSTFTGSRPPLPAPHTQTRAADPGPFLRSVAELTQRMANGELQKVVLSRDVRVQAQDPIDGLAVLVRLPPPPATGATFGFRRRGEWFLGATPEHLVLRRGQQLSTMALAGTAAHDADPAQLLSSPKDRAEHAVVVEHVLAQLQALGASGRAPASPEILALKNVLHLYTPIHAELSSPLHLLALADRLQPTPAVAGAPLLAALRAIAAAEGRPRGRYAGSVGWFDARGQGELYVALRAATIKGREADCHVGVGLVAASTPEAEWQETEWKARTMLEALGAGR